MSVIRTKTNMVVAHEPEPGDKFVRVVWFGPSEDGRHARAFEGPPWPIDQYQQSVDWALGMADYMRSPIYVEPLTARESRRTPQ
jgi:hypothetical protein